MAYPATIFGAEKDVYATSTFQLYPLGQKMQTPNGSIFRYSEMGGTIGVAAKLYQSEVPTAGWLTQAVVTTALTVGNTTINFRPTTTALAVNDLAEGTVLVEETDDLGHIYLIKSHAAAAADADTTLYLADGVTVQVSVAIAAGNVLTCIKNPWKDVIIKPAADSTAFNVGVPRVIIAANAFGWVQSRGVASCLVEGTHLISDFVGPSSTAAGALAPTSGVIPALAYSLEVAPTADFGHVFLIID